MISVSRPANHLNAKKKKQRKYRTLALIYMVSDIHHVFISGHPIYYLGLVIYDQQYMQIRKINNTCMQEKITQ